MHGKVYLVGAGPGDYELITLKGLEALKKAEVLIYDRLTAPEFLSMVPRECERLYVGKKSSEHTLQQTEINDLLVKKSLEGKCVVRLKGGDPYVFGRGGEEAEHLFTHGIPFEVIPGITSAIGGLAYAGIPITHRDYASSFHVITGHLKSEESDHDWEAIAGYEGTLVFLMGVSNLPKIQERLMFYGKSGDTPTGIVEWATTQRQRKVITTLDKICFEADRLKFQSPSIIVIGEVVNAHSVLDTWSNKPLFGKKIAITRGREQSSTLATELRTYGADVIETPTIRIVDLKSEPLSNAISQIKVYNQLIFTSANSVHYFFIALEKAGMDARSLSHMTCTVIGTATYEALKQRGVRADHMPENYMSESLWKTLEPIIKPDDRVLIPRAKGARPFLVDRLSSMCSVDEILIYEALPDERSKLDEAILSKIDYVTFTSSSTVKHFFKIYGKNATQILNRAVAVSIGPVTTQTLCEHGINHVIEAKSFNIEGIIEVLLKEVHR